VRQKVTGTTENVERQVPGPLAPGSSVAKSDVIGLATEEMTASANRFSHKMTLKVCASPRSFMAIIHGETAIRGFG
jgi:hypothetical protein